MIVGGLHGNINALGFTPNHLGTFAPQAHLIRISLNLKPVVEALWAPSLAHSRRETIKSRRGGA